MPQIVAHTDDAITMSPSSISPAASESPQEQRDATVVENAGETVRAPNTRHHVRHVEQDLASIGKVDDTDSDENLEGLQSEFEAQGGSGTASSAMRGAGEQPGKQISRSQMGHVLTTTSSFTTAGCAQCSLARRLNQEYG